MTDIHTWINEKLGKTFHSYDLGWLPYKSRNGYVMKLAYKYEDYIIVQYYYAKGSARFHRREVLNMDNTHISNQHEWEMDI